jgi:hypothetical protein
MRDEDCPMGMRQLGTWSDEDILQTLFGEGRKRDIQVFTKFLEVGYKGLDGGSVVIVKPDLEHYESTEYERAVNIGREFGRLTPDIHYMTKEEWEDIKSWG